MYKGWMERQMYNHVPEYYHGMERDGFSYHEVKYAWKNYVMKQHEERLQKERYQKALNTAVSEELRQALELAKKEICDSFK